MQITAADGLGWSSRYPRLTSLLVLGFLQVVFNLLAGLGLTLEQAVSNGLLNNLSANDIAVLSGSLNKTANGGENRPENASPAPISSAFGDSMSGPQGLSLPYGL